MTNPVRSAIAACLILIFAGPTLAQRRPRPNRENGGVINLPYQFSDGNGGMWLIQQTGYMQSNGNMPVYSQAANLTINGNNPSQQNNTAKRDPKTSEIVLEDLQCAPFVVTRRVFFDKEANSLRYIDVIRNPTKDSQNAAVQYQVNTNYGVTSMQTVEDPAKAGQQLGWVAMTGANRAVVVMFAGKRAKTTFQLVTPEGNNTCQATTSLVIPGGKSVALMSVYSTSTSVDAGAASMTGMKESKILSSIPIDLRKLIVNFPVGLQLINEREVLRGDVYDVVELRTGDTINGTLKDPTYSLATFYGNVDIPAEKVIGLINVGAFHPRQLLVTAGGEVFGGQLKKETVALELASGQITQVPLSQIARIGYRKKAGEPEEWTFEKPLVVFRSGDRMEIAPPTEPINVATRYGGVAVPVASLAAIAFQSEDHGVHEVLLTDGSKFAGLVSADQFAFTLAGSSQQVKVATSNLTRLQMKPPTDDIDSAAAQMKLANGDLFVGHIAGALKITTSFDTLDVNGSEIRGMTRAPESATDVILTLWDGSRMSGSLNDPTVPVTLGSGAKFAIPLGLIESYEDPFPTPSATMVDKIKSLVADLNNDDFKKRDAAEASIVGMGDVVIGTLKSLRDAQPPEGQQRIDSALAKLQKGDAKESTPAPAVPADER